MRTTIRIEGALEGELHEAYLAQLGEVRRSIEGRAEEEAVTTLGRVMAETFRSNFGLTAEQAAALARLAVEMPPADARIPRLVAVSERCALQRALVVVRRAQRTAPYFAVAAAAAASAFAVAAEDIVVADPSKPRPSVPAMPKRPSQDTTIDESAPRSPYFAERWE